MEKALSAAPDTQPRVAGKSMHKLEWERWGVLYARIALGAAFLSAVASRFGLWEKTVDLKHFASFIHFTAQVLSFIPAAFIPLLAWAATAAETTLGILLISGLWPRSVSLAAAILLAMFGTSMAISFGLESPMDYSVFSASGAAVLLSLHASSQYGKKIVTARKEGCDREV
jgi:putative oxidoreductase